MRVKDVLNVLIANIRNANYNNKMIKLFYYIDTPNFGDLLSPIIIEWLSNRKTVWVDAEETNKLVSTGSLISSVRENDVVWGSGLIADYELDLPETAKIIAVRGPLTRDRIKNVYVPEIYGDPVLLMPRIYHPNIEKQYKIGCIPHYVDKDRFNLSDKILTIDVNHPNPLETIDKILSCEIIISTSLHGIIAAEAYGIPAIWLRVSDGIIGGVFKFNDYLASTNREASPIIFNEIVTDEDILKVLDSILPIPKINIDLLIEAWNNYYNGGN